MEFNFERIKNTVDVLLNGDKYSSGLIKKIDFKNWSDEKILKSMVQMSPLVYAHNDYYHKISRPTADFKEIIGIEIYEQAMSVLNLVNKIIVEYNKIYGYADNAKDDGTNYIMHDEYHSSDELDPKEIEKMKVAILYKNIGRFLIDDNYNYVKQYYEIYSAVFAKEILIIQGRWNEKDIDDICRIILRQNHNRLNHRKDVTIYEVLVMDANLLDSKCGKRLFNSVVKVATTISLIKRIRDIEEFFDDYDSDDYFGRDEYPPKSFSEYEYTDRYFGDDHMPYEIVPSHNTKFSADSIAKLLINEPVYIDYSLARNILRRRVYKYKRFIEEKVMLTEAAFYRVYKEEMKCTFNLFDEMIDNDEEIFYDDIDDLFDYDEDDDWD